MPNNAITNLALVLPVPARARHRPVALWLFVLAAMVAVMVALGGLTRLTGSGLSMVEWNPHHILPPLTHDQWLEAFAKYRDSPEYQQVNHGMDLAGFQSIFWLEYVHRLWGRLLGLAFALPFVWFLARGMVSRALAWRLAAIFALGAAQGGMGWLMVASGLVDVPQVSHLRLAAHLLLAFAILGLLLWTGLQVPAPARGRVSKAVAALLALTLVVAGWGAMVAGLHAGHIHNTFPLMGETLFPAEGLALAPAWINAIENPAAVQYVHRVLAVTLVACTTLVFLARGGRALRLAALWTWGQAGLGIATLLLSVPVSLAALHQMGAVMLFALLTWALHSERRGME